MSMDPRKNLVRYAWGVLGYNVLVILWGAYVRATGSGAGCGSHWPLCDGVVVPREAVLATRVEFSHRISSAIAFLLVLGLFLWVRRSYPRGHHARRAAMFSMVFISLEALIGAGLVLFELVAENESVARGISISIHLINTFLLLGSLSAAAAWIGGTRPPRSEGRRGSLWAFILVALGFMILGVSGAIAALGDTLFPADSLREALLADLSAEAHIFIRLRIFHPVIAIFVAGMAMFATRVPLRRKPSRRVRNLADFLFLVILFQLIAGGLNVILLAPVWMQILHLLLADLVWILFVLYGIESMAAPLGRQDQAGQPVGFASLPTAGESPTGS